MENKYISSMKIKVSAQILLWNWQDKKVGKITHFFTMKIINKRKIFSEIDLNHTCYNFDQVQHKMESI